MFVVSPCGIAHASSSWKKDGRDLGLHKIMCSRRRGFQRNCFPGGQVLGVVSNKVPASSQLFTSNRIYTSLENNPMQICPLWTEANGLMQIFLRLSLRFHGSKIAQSMQETRNPACTSTIKNSWSSYSEQVRITKYRFLVSCAVVFWPTKPDSSLECTGRSHSGGFSLLPDSGLFCPLSWPILGAHHVWSQNQSGMVSPLQNQTAQ